MTTFRGNDITFGSDKKLVGLQPKQVHFGSVIKNQTFFIVIKLFI